MKQAAIRVGLIGFGAAGRMMHAPLLAATAGMDLVAVATSRPDMVRTSLPNCRVFTTPEDLLAAADVDLVVIASPDATHTPLAIAALESGHHVLVEKPFALSLDAAHAALAAAERSGKTAMAFQNRRYDSDFLTLSAAIAANVCGPVRRLESRFERPFNPSAPITGEQLWFDLGPHLVDQALQLFGPPEQVSAQFAAPADDGENLDWGFVELLYADRTVRLHMANALPGSGSRFVVEGEAGRLVKHRGDPQGRQIRGGQMPRSSGWGEDEDPLIVELSGRGTASMQALAGDYTRFYEDVGACLRGMGANPTAPEVLLDITRVIAAAIEANRADGAPVELGPIPA